ncbi:diphthamide biosynthesis protein [Hypoxylon trugodes]|uniref:diphthamide biosynthesis protein n=1 Tax=Hypoxylon trugodes TaxID=326681 RepID=UPI0021A14B89|nr:diphthamide biosynthesis protein [Hypoxylon trugodes]KAI1393040.1 diphthamide biosynthesis protein [Hypoxylon trugodes]
MASELSAAPVLSTPAEHTFFEDPTPASAIEQAKRPHRPDHELYEVYEIVRTVAEVRQNGWKRIALQFPDAMLPDAPWVVGALSSELEKEQKENQEQKQRLYILADTSYSSCCVDEIAAEHADADGVVHYGRACLSPTSRLPVLHIFTRQKLDYETVAEAFEIEFPEKTEKTILMADVMFQEHVTPICELLSERGYTNVIATEIVRDPTGTIPNRKLVFPDESADYNLNEYHLFHIATPPTSLLLTLSSRLASLRIYSTPSSPYTTTSETPDPSTTPALLRRRYALVIRLATASIIGILVNTLSVKNYMSTISTLRSQIAAAGKKSYTIVVGKLNAAKLANFAEIDGWVVVGCWESGLVEHENLWKPVITPFELELALQGEESRIWTGEWWGGIEGVKAPAITDGNDEHNLGQEKEEVIETTGDVEGGVDDEESEPPEFDLRTGKLVSHSRPMRLAIRSVPRSAPKTDTVSLNLNPASSAIVKRAVGDVALVNGVASPGAEFLRSQRTWQGLGTDFGAEDDNEESTVVEEGRSGIARGYTVGSDRLQT